MAEKESKDGYVALARRYRPQTFDEVVGQSHVAQTLRNAIELNRLSHAYLFTGPRGCGKTTLARIFAKSLNCRAADKPTANPCGKCVSCVQIAAGEDLDVLEMDGASHNSVDDVRLLRESLAQATTGSRYKVIYIDEVHMLSIAAFNALLKSLEEPPAHVKFIFATTDPQKLPATIIARCQRYEIKLIGSADMAEVLERICKKEKIPCETGAIPAIVRAAKGGLRDAENLLDQAICYGAGKLTRTAVEDLSGAISDVTLSAIIDGAQAGDMKIALGAVAQSLSGGAQPGDLLNGLLEYIHAIMMWKSLGPDHADLVVWKHHGATLDAQATRWSPALTLTALQVLQQLERELRFSPYPRMAIDAAVAQLCQLQDLVDLGAVLREPASGAPVGGGTGAPQSDPRTNRPGSGPTSGSNYPPAGQGASGSGYGATGGVIPPRSPLGKPSSGSGFSGSGPVHTNAPVAPGAPVAPAAAAPRAMTAPVSHATSAPAAPPAPAAQPPRAPSRPGVSASQPGVTEAGSGAGPVAGAVPGSSAITREAVLAALGLDFKPNLRNILLHANGLFVKVEGAENLLVVLLGQGSPQKSRALESGQAELLGKLAQTLGGRWRLQIRGGLEGSSISGRHEVVKPASTGALPGKGAPPAPATPPPLSPAVEAALDLFGGEVVEQNPPEEGGEER
ncbi:MAG TPA: DNA polymerase III subunit gamma/tau [Planctomycetota bacterium]|nr:DNA polymerase III subunit gamma/tau [Planctomycetota bacterium]